MVEASAGPGVALGPLVLLVALPLLALFVAGLVLSVVLLVRFFRAGRPEAGGAVGPGPLDVLKLRYAQGELTREQFEQMKRDLEA